MCSCSYHLRSVRKTRETVGDSLSRDGLIAPIQLEEKQPEGLKQPKKQPITKKTDDQQIGRSRLAGRATLDKGRGKTPTYNRSHSAHFSDNPGSHYNGDSDQSDDGFHRRKIGSNSASYVLNLSNDHAFETENLRKGQQATKRGTKRIHRKHKRENHFKSDEEPDNNSKSMALPPKESAILRQGGPLPERSDSPISQVSQLPMNSVLMDQAEHSSEDQIVFPVNKRRFKLVCRKVEVPPVIEDASPSPVTAHDRDESVNRSCISESKRSVISTLRDEGSVKHSQASGQVNFEGKLTINGYELGECIGSGSFGKVYKARHLLEKKYYVVKALKRL